MKKGKENMGGGKAKERRKGRIRENKEERNEIKEKKREEKR